MSIKKNYCLIISGSSGSGKTSVSKLLWKTLPNNPAYLSLDSLKHLPHGAVSNDHYLNLARINALDITKNMLNSGHSVIVEKAFGSYKFVGPFIELSKSMGVDSAYFKLVAPLSVLIERVEARRNLSLERKIEFGEWPFPMGDRNTAEEIYNFFERNQHSEGIEIDTSVFSVEEVAEIIRTHLSFK